MIHASCSLRRSLLILAGMLLFGAVGFSGKVSGRPSPHPPERRQAAMLMLRFQDALAAERWEDALALCSDRVRNAATKWPTPKEFFTETIPIDHVLAQDFACWSCGTNFYGLFVTLSAPGVEPRIDWFWGFVPTKNGWIVDYPPAKLDEYVVAKRAAFRERDERIKQIRHSLEPKVQGVRTQLTPVSDRFVVGAPMLFRVELVNSGPTPVHYMDLGVRHKPLAVANGKQEPIDYVPRPLQIQVQRGELASGKSVVLAERIDINQGREIAAPGNYLVRFDSADLQIGEPIPRQETGRFGETLSIAVFDFLPATNTFPSNPIKIEVVP